MMDDGGWGQPGRSWGWQTDPPVVDYRGEVVSGIVGGSDQMHKGSDQMDDQIVGSGSASGLGRAGDWQSSRRPVPEVSRIWF